ncbi:MAG TPA: hypothetical protein DCS87_01380 [Rheinheimera sp.]|nr:hypothetical protein [Rheinheimera sp.]
MHRQNDGLTDTVLAKNAGVLNNSQPPATGSHAASAYRDFLLKQRFANPLDIKSRLWTSLTN